MKSSLFVTEIQLLSFSPLEVIITNHWIYAWNRSSIANKMMINWVLNCVLCPLLLPWEISAHSGVHQKRLQKLIPSDYRWGESSLRTFLILTTLIVSKIAVGDDNAEDLDYRQIIGIATPPKQSQSRQSLFVLDLREWGGGLLGWERRGIQLPLWEFSAFLDHVPRSGGGLWRDTIGDWDLHRKIMMKCKCCFSSFCHIIVQLVMILLINLPLVAPTCIEQTFQFVPVPEISGWFEIISICSTPH